MTAAVRNIWVNGQLRAVESEWISFNAIVRFAFPRVGTEDPGITITFRHGHHSRPEGELVQGDQVRIGVSTIFRVAYTGAA